MYTLNDLAVMSGFTTRTLRNYMNLGLLHGEKINGKWQFTAEELGDFFADSNIKEALRSKDRTQIFDFIADDKKDSNAACVVLDLVVDLSEGNRISAFFCDAINAEDDVHFSYTFQNNHARVILTGPERNVQNIMAAYYNCT